jgi:uncharacterized protein YbcC (UPF0753/DUF2309 family)
VQTETTTTEKTSLRDDRKVPGASALNNEGLDLLLREVCGRVAPVWPLTNFIAVNPMQGFESEPFVAADAIARKYFRARALPKLAYFHRKFRQGRIRFETLRAVAEDHAQSGAAEALAQALRDHANEGAAGEERAPSSDDAFLTLSEWCDELVGTRLVPTMEAEIVKWSSAYFDLGEAAWAMPGKERGFYEAWKALARYDRSFENAGVSGFRRFVDALPGSSRDAVAECLDRLAVPGPLRRDYLLRHLFTAPGWAGMFVHYGAERAHVAGEEPLAPVVDYLAVRLAYDAAGAAKVGCERLGERDPWTALLGLALRRHAVAGGVPSEAGTAPSPALVWLEAFEKEYRDGLLARLGATSRKLAAETATKAERPVAQAIFCIDVRSECFRRHLEATGAIETFGFAGFFAIPLAYRPLGEEYVESQCPVLLRPKFVVADRLVDRAKEAKWVASHRSRQAVDVAVKETKNTAIAPFALVETFGAIGAWSMLTHTFWPSLERAARRWLASAKAREIPLTGDVEGEASLYPGGIPLADRIAIAENAMRIMGLGVGGAPLARLVLFCGHGSTTTNNAYASALNCGACGGHRGAPNARVAAAIFNDPEVRSALAERGLPVPEDTLFVAAEHDTATDDLHLYDEERLPETHRGDLSVLRGKIETARRQLNFERTQRFDVPATTLAEAVTEVRRRSLDWSEVRPEWGLAGNAAFIVARRALTGNLDLGGRAFLHSYRWETDPTGSALEVIMTAPMIVAEWINTQYYFSSIDNKTYGSGSKVIHNVVGKLGVMQGNQSDLKLGLPLQSVSDGNDLVHEPMRLCVVIEAPKDRIAAIVAKHDSVRKLVVNGWVYLVALDPHDGKAYRYRAPGTWHAETAFESSEKAASPATPLFH